MLVTRLLRLCMMFAMLFAPLGMIGDHAAMATRTAAVAGTDHGAMMRATNDCPGDEAPSRDLPASSVDCTIACSVLPGAETGIAARPKPAVMAPAAPPATGLAGLHPESDPPPPRFS